jgi:pimeloyl-ACP methyl ester carboxylesterase
VFTERGGKEMSEPIPWNSQPLDVWAEKHAQGKFIDLAGRATHYIERGEGEPVILLHGYFYDSYLWAANLDVLAERFKVYALDLWGFGYSTREPMDYGYPLYAEQVLMYMDGLGIQRASLMGQSMGGGTAILFCVEHRDRVRKLVLVEPAGWPQPLPLIGKLFNLPRVGEFLLALNTDAVRKGLLANQWVFNKDLLTETYFENVTRFHKVKGTTEAFLAILRKQFFHTLSDELHRLGQMDVPILLVWGREHSPIALHSGEEMHRVLEGHVPNYERPVLFNELAMNFLLGQG